MSEDLGLAEVDQVPIIISIVDSILQMIHCARMIKIREGGLLDPGHCSVDLLQVLVAGVGVVQEDPHLVADAVVSAPLVHRSDGGQQSREAGQTEPGHAVRVVDEDVHSRGDVMR